MPHGASISSLPVANLLIALWPDPARVVIRPFVPADNLSIEGSTRSGAQRIGDRVLGLNEAQVHSELERVSSTLGPRHRDLDATLLRRFHEVDGLKIDHCLVSPQQARLIGAFFCEEYSFEAAALFNPSMVLHPDQSRVPSGYARFILSLRAIGEGHISSITFRTGLCSADGAVVLDPTSVQALSPRTELIPGVDPEDPGVRIICEPGHDLSEIVIFPITPRQRHGIEDLRLVRFTDDDGAISYLGTYTAFSGSEARQELLSTKDFTNFQMSAFRGKATVDKGMALFPRRIGGRYAMLGRQDHESIWIATSDDLNNWEHSSVLLSPKWIWEFVQIGNGGSPIEIDEGWLVITHGVGAARTYCLGVCLLDRDDPSIVLARSSLPLIAPGLDALDGYVPNVVYTCGAMVHNRVLILPYAVADSFTTFATIALDRLLAAMH
jgi:predicted GH43/DUF377 family glycosyl hydrolase